MNISPYTMVDQPRLDAVLRAIDRMAGRPGAFVECGVWRGGVCMLAAGRLMELGDLRDIYLFDTFEGLPPPTSEDGDGARDYWQEGRLKGALEDVRANMASTGYPAELVHYVVGKVEDTMPLVSMPDIAVLRLDTDWYSSTKAELDFLYPKLVSGGQILIDDFGHWQGCNKAVREYFAAHPPAPEWTQDDYTGISGAKP